MKTQPIDIQQRPGTVRRSAFHLLPFAFYLILLPFATRAQTYITPPTTGTLAPGDYFNNLKIDLTAPFSFTPAAGQRLHLYITGADCVPLVTAPSSDKTYIMSSVPRVAGITSAGQLANRNACDLMQIIQYFDGLGRPIQSVQVQGSPTNKDLVQPIAYDGVGREQYKYLPYAPQTGTADGSYKSDALTASNGLFKFYNPTGTGTSGNQQSNGVVVIPDPFAQTGFEESPLDRVIEQGAPGDSWQLGSGHTVRMDYGTNAGDIILWTINTGGNGAAHRSNYTAGQLYKTIATDENGHGTTVYKDKDGRVVCKQFANSTRIYYIYDNMGNLCYVIPPLPSTAANGNPAVSMPSSFTESDNVFKNFFYGYHYDSRLRQTEKKVPGKDWQYMVYNKLDQPILTQDANQMAKGIWMVEKYDAQGRVVMTGELTSASTRATLQSAADASTTYLYETFTNAATNYGYTHVTYPDITVNIKVLTTTYFDNYSVISNTAVNPSATNFPAPNVAVDTLLQTPTGLPVATLVNVLGTTNYLFTVTHYDTYGRPVNVISQNYVGGSPSADKYDTEISKYSFQSLPVSTIRKHYVSGLQLTINSWISYDHMNRPLTSRQQFITSTVTGKINTLSKVDYNEIGQSITKHLGSVASGDIPASNTFLQHVNLRYNERGWLSTINNPANLTDPDYPGIFDVFAERLDYDKPVNYATSLLNYNGNITSVAWQTKTPASLTGFAQERKGYIFAYDAMNQMTGSVSQAATSGANLFNENVSYDDLGNIMGLNRNSGGSILNDITYSYTSGGVRGNRLLSVTDVTPYTESQGSTYTYDANGSLLTDTKKTITTPIVYNELNLPSLVTITTGSKTLTYRYDATGKKLERITKTGTTVAEDRVYDDGIEYTGTTAATLDFVHTAEGRAVPSAGNYNYQYEVADHLGNIRALFADANNNGVLTANEIIQFSDYYPFGREISYPSLSLTPANNYKYNGKEFQNDLSEYDYGARFYDPVIGRWNVIDPMAEVNRRFSSYNYVENNPVRMIDPDGMASSSDMQEGDSPIRFNDELVRSKRWAEGGAYNDGRGDGKGQCCVTRPDHTAGKQPPVDPRTFSHTSYKTRKLAETIAYKWVVKARTKARQEWNKQHHIPVPLASGRATLLIPENAIIVIGSAGYGLLGEGAASAGSLTFYRTMSNEAAESFLTTGAMPAGTETFVSPTLSFAQKFEGVTFEINTNSGTLSELETIGVRNAASGHPYPNLPLVESPWMKTNAFFKVEGSQVNLGLGNGNALKIFNSNIQSFKIVK